MFNDADFFRNPITLLKEILNWNLLYWVIIIITINNNNNINNNIISAVINVRNKIGL